MTRPESFIDLPIIEEYKKENVIAELKKRVREMIKKKERMKDVDILIGKGNLFYGVVKCSKNLKKMDKFIEREEEINPELILGKLKVKTEASEYMCVAEEV